MSKKYAKSYPWQSDEECPDGAIGNVEFLVSFSYLEFTFPKITSLIIVFANILKTYGHYMLATLWYACYVLDIERYIHIGIVYIFKD